MSTSHHSLLAVFFSELSNHEMSSHLLHMSGSGVDRVAKKFTGNGPSHPSWGYCTLCPRLFSKPVPCVTVGRGTWWCGFDGTTQQSGLDVNLCCIWWGKSFWAREQQVPGDVEKGLTTEGCRLTCLQPSHKLLALAHFRTKGLAHLIQVGHATDSVPGSPASWSCNKIEKHFSHLFNSVDRLQGPTHPWQELYHWATDQLQRFLNLSEGLIILFSTFLNI